MSFHKINQEQLEYLAKLSDACARAEALGLRFCALAAPRTRLHWLGLKPLADKRSKVQRFYTSAVRAALSQKASLTLTGSAA